MTTQRTTDKTLLERGDLLPEADHGVAPPVADVPQRRGGYTPEDYDPFIGKHPYPAKITPPNFEAMKQGDLINVFTSSGMDLRRGSFLAPGGSHPVWALYGLGRNQRGQLNGAGYVMYYVSAYGSEGGQGGRFAICKHEPIEGEGANHMRGWHPAHCGRCGLDLSVDSGD